MLDDLLEKLERNAGKKGGQHFVFIGPRGIGKTHFLTLIDNRVRKSETLSQRYTVIFFPEENSRLLSFADFLLGVVEILADETADDAWKRLYETLSVNEIDDAISDAVVPRLKAYQKETGRTLLILLENLDVIFTEQIRNGEHIHQFRHFLMDSPCVTLIGTTPVYFPGLCNVKSPLYDFFDIQVMDELDEERTLEVVRKNFTWDGRDDLLASFDQLESKIRALHTMTGGNPRLILMLYELIANDNVLDVKNQFQRLLDAISPFYQDRMKELAPQERAVLETIALMRTVPRTPAAIAKRLRKSAQQTSALLKRMTQAGYLSITENPQDRRSRFYRIREGFFDLWLAMSESRAQRKCLPWLVEFFEKWYQDQKERETKRKALWGQIVGEGDKSRVDAKNREVLYYLSEVGNQNEKIQTKFELVLHDLNKKDLEKASEYLAEIDALSPKGEAMVWITSQTHRWLGEGVEEDVRKWLANMIDYWKHRRSGDLEKAVTCAQRLGVELSGHGLHRVNIDLLTDAVSQTNNASDKVALLFNIAQSQKAIGLMDDALRSLNEALPMAPSLEARGAMLNNISQIYQARGDYETALKFLQESLDIQQEIGDRAGEGTTLNNMATIAHARGDYETALKYLQESLKISKEIGNRAGMIPTLHNMARIALQANDVRQAMERWSEALDLAMETQNAQGIFHVAGTIGQVLAQAGDREQAAQLLRLAVQVGQQAGFPGIADLTALLRKMQ